MVEIFTAGPMRCEHIAYFSSKAQCEERKTELSQIPRTRKEFGYLCEAAEPEIDCYSVWQKYRSEN